MPRPPQRAVDDSAGAEHAAAPPLGCPSSVTCWMACLDHDVLRFLVVLVDLFQPYRGAFHSDCAGPPAHEFIVAPAE